jgi:hypothetical protein
MGRKQTARNFLRLNPTKTNNKMLTKIKFKAQHPTLNAMQLQSAYQLSEIDGWHVEGKTASKEGVTLQLLENGNALK